jgi:hypothetical protein
VRHRGAGLADLSLHALEDRLALRHFRLGRDQRPGRSPVLQPCHPRTPVIPAMHLDGADKRRSDYVEGCLVVLKHTMSPYRNFDANRRTGRRNDTVGYGLPITG